MKGVTVTKTYTKLEQYLFFCFFSQIGLKKLDAAVNISISSKIDSPLGISLTSHCYV